MLLADGSKQIYMAASVFPLCSRGGCALHVDCASGVSLPSKVFTNPGFSFVERIAAKLSAFAAITFWMKLQIAGLAEGCAWAAAQNVKTKTEINNLFIATPNVDQIFVNVRSSKSRHRWI